MSRENLIHIKLEHDEAIESRKDVLTTEADLIRIAQAVRKYRALRLKELALKIELYRKIKEFKNDLKRLKIILPKLQIPKILKKFEEGLHEADFEEEKPKKQKIEKEKKEEKPKKPADELEAQLMEIQEKLNKLR